MDQHPARRGGQLYLHSAWSGRTEHEYRSDRPLKQAGRGVGKNKQTFLVNVKPPVFAVCLTHYICSEENFRPGIMLVF